jgi:mRNA-degrading endonuclease YafQ of YafQ-DinJ toxin-antitoxin module
MRKEKYSLNTSSRVDKKIQKLIKGDKKLDKRLRKVFRQLEVNPFYKGLKTHRVYTPKWEEAYSSRVTGDLRLIWYLYEDNLLILIIDIGGHEGSKSVY